jgi:DNA polymerase-1
MTTSAPTVLARCRDRGIELQVCGENIKLIGTKDARDELRPAILACKPELLALLRESPPPPAVPTSEPPANRDGGYELVTSDGQLEVVAQAVHRAGKVALDIETTGLDPILDSPRLLQLALPDGPIYVIDLKTIGNISVLGKALATVTAVGHHIQFDLVFLKHHHGIVVRQARCTMSAARLLDAGLHFKAKNYFTLAAVADRYLGIELDKTLQTSMWSGTLTPEQLSYAAADVRHLLHVHDALEQALREQHLTGVYGLECDLIPVVVDMQLAGVPMDATRWQGYIALQQKTLHELEQQLAAELPGINPRSSKQVLPALRALGCDIASTSADALAVHLGVPVVQHLLKYRSTLAFVRGPGAAIANALARHGDNRVHVALFPLAAPTGRMSCRAPNLMALPKSHDVRRCVVAGPGNNFVRCDYAAIELRVLAEVTQDPRLLQVFRTGGDPHRATAALLLHKPEAEVTKAERQRAKPANFGVSFGMGAPRFVDYARTDYGVELSLEEAKKFVMGFRAAYVGVAAWQVRTGRLMPSAVRTASGRLRRFDEDDGGYCERLNTPIQGTAADGMKRAMVLLHQQLPRLGARLVLVVHDEVLVEAPAAVVEEVKTVVESAMRKGMEDYVSSVPIEAKASIQRTWAENDVVERMPDAGGKLTTP